MFAVTESAKYFTKIDSKVYCCFLDASKAFDKVLHNGVFKKLLDKNVPVVLVNVLHNWYSNLQCSVRWNNVYGAPFMVKCGVRQGGVLSPYLFALYVDELIVQLRQSGYGLRVGQQFVGCVVYADDIALLSASCYGLQKVVDICCLYGKKWDLSFNPVKSQLITLGGPNPIICPIQIDGKAIHWVNKVKYLGVYFLVDTGLTDVTDIIRKFYGKFNSIMSVLGKGSNELTALHLINAYCLPSLLYGCEVWNLTDNSLHKLSVAWNNCFRNIFSCCWRESVKPLQYYCHTLPVAYHITCSVSCSSA